uniref:Protein kinase domain-containing protein n=1 Tax=Ascaris lumbricoides TaxID=6252 RepID=A0A0M3HXH6_ASCLU
MSKSPNHSKITKDTESFHNLNHPGASFAERHRKVGEGSSLRLGLGSSILDNVRIEKRFLRFYPMSPPRQTAPRQSPISSYPFPIRNSPGTIRTATATTDRKDSEDISAHMVANNSLNSVVAREPNGACKKVTKMYKKGVRNTKRSLNRGVAHSARGTHSRRRTGTGTRRTTTRAASVQPSVLPAAAGQAPCKVESETPLDATPHCLPSVFSEASPLARYSLGSLTEELYGGGNVKEPIGVSVKLEQPHDDVDLHHPQLDQAHFETHPHASLDPACSTSNAPFDRSPGLQRSDIIMVSHWRQDVTFEGSFSMNSTCRLPCKEDTPPWLDVMMPSTSSAFDRSPISGSLEVNPKRPNQNVMLEGSIGANIQVNHTPNANYDEEDEALLEAAIVTIPKHSSAVKVTKRSRQDMMLEEPVAIPSAQRTKPKVSKRISAFNRSSFLRSLKGKDESRQLASLPERQHHRLSRTTGPSDADHRTVSHNFYLTRWHLVFQERSMENPRNIADLPSEPNARSVALRMREQECDDRGAPSAAECCTSIIPIGREVANSAAEGVLGTAILNAIPCGSSIAPCEAPP